MLNSNVEETNARIKLFPNRDPRIKVTEEMMTLDTLGKWAEEILLPRTRWSAQATYCWPSCGGLGTLIETFVDFIDAKI